VRPGDLDKTEHAMNSLMASVAWDEARFGLTLDLERFMIVATSDFNMGAMENKGLNIFNTKYVLASQATATDTDYSNIESVVGHEYFHNWTGNRVTCRDWFQLSLKEGLTVFRDQEFSQDLAGEPSARAVKRIEDVRVLRTAQFPEDAGPHGAPRAPGPVPGDQQLLHGDRLRKRRRGRAHDADPGGARGFRPRNGAVLPAPRWPCCHLRRLRAGHRRRESRFAAGKAAAPVQTLVQPGRHTARQGGGPLRRWHGHLRTHPVPELSGHARAVGQASLHHPHRPWACWAPTAAKSPTACMYSRRRAKP
jgi:hypothetical protein